MFNLELILDEFKWLWIYKWDISWLIFVGFVWCWIWFFGSLKIKSFYFLRLICLFSSSLFTFRFNAHCHCVDAWISAGKSNGFDAMEKEKKKKKDARSESSEGTERERKSQEEDKNWEISQITMWHVFIGWRKSSVLRQFRTEFKLILIFDLVDVLTVPFFYSTLYSTNKNLSHVHLIN